MAGYVYIMGRHHGVTSGEIDDQIEHLEKTIRSKLPAGTKWHGKYCIQRRRRVHPSLLRKRLIFTFAGRKGLKHLDEIWYQTWIFVIYLRIEGNLREYSLRTLLGLHMTVERLECTDGRRLDRVTSCMLQLTVEIPWSDNWQAANEGYKDCRYFGKRFEIGRHI